MLITAVPAVRAVVEEHLMEFPVERGPGVHGLPVAPVPPVVEVEEPMTKLLVVPEVEEELLLLPPTARLGGRAHAAVHDLTVGGGVTVVARDIVEGRIVVLRLAVRHDKSLLHFHVLQVRPHFPVPGKIVAEVRARVLQPVIAVPKVAVTVRVAATDGILEAPRFPRVERVDELRVEAAGGGLGLYLRFRRRLLGDEVDGPAQRIAVTGIGHALEYLHGLHVGERDRGPVDEVAAGRPRRIERPAVHPELDAA